MDCDTSPYTTDVAEYPSGIGDTNHVVSFFADQFGFNEQEATAIMGECWPWFTFFIKPTTIAINQFKSMSME